jgi:alpha-amylase/alpha-mannosidase (GH57 family)
MNRYICIHGHFYQPPRENPWLEEVEVQDSAYPFHDWNERITAECYAPNSASRILDSEKNIIDIVNNYSKISFNFGPTLLSWMEKHDLEVYRAIIEADRESQRKFSGHGSAVAQVYSHMIMPLANSRDKRTQVVWGIKDFENRFKRKPEGMWLPETAVDIETLETLAAQEIQFTILSPHQAKRFRKIGDKNWNDASGGRIDPRMPYLCRLPSGAAINIFHYDRPISLDIAFGDLLSSGELFIKRLFDAFSKDQERPQIVHIATDGESYGHHHRFGDMALAYCLDEIESSDFAALTIYSEYLERFPPEYEVEIVERSSWSCEHGVERWRNNCGCNAGRQAGWTQEWRAPLREAMDWLRDKLVSLYESRMSAFTKDPWKARDDYVEVMLDRSKKNVESFFSRHCFRELSWKEKVRILKLLEIERHAMFMYTSCGWFFDEITGIETVQVMEYASRAMQLAREVADEDFEPDYTGILERAPSNVAEFKNGARVYERLVKPAVLDFLRIGVHYAVSSLFEDYSESVSLGGHTINREKYDIEESGRERLAVGKARVRSNVVWEEDNISFAVLHLGDHNLIGGARRYTETESFSLMEKEVKEAFGRSDVPEIIRLMDKHFGTHNYSLWHLFKDEKRRVLGQIMESTMEEVETSFRQIFENYYPVMQAMRETRVPLPKAFKIVLEFVLNSDFRKLMEKEDLDLEQIRKGVDEFNKWPIKPDQAILTFITSQKIYALMKEFFQKPGELSLAEAIDNVLKILKDLPLEFDQWKSQNIYFKHCKEHLDKMQERSLNGDPVAKKWLNLMKSIGIQLGVKCM